jgi:uncharacterized protein YoxC
MNISIQLWIIAISQIAMLIAIVVIIISLWNILDKLNKTASAMAKILDDFEKHKVFDKVDKIADVLATIMDNFDKRNTFDKIDNTVDIIAKTLENLDDHMESIGDVLYGLKTKILRFYKLLDFVQGELESVLRGITMFSGLVKGIGLLFTKIKKRGGEKRDER